MKALELFDPLTARWFQSRVGTPTAVQEAAWPLIAAGEHTLVSAPTGTGKTLSAFLVFLDRLMARAREETLGQELHLIYVSPLKSLAGDIRENLRRPLDGILEEMRAAGAFQGESPLRVAIRTGDTSPGERRRMAQNPPHILITTPESLFLLLSSKSGQAMLQTARAVILDELHALIDTKRGAHLMLSLARLDRLCGKPLQRIGLSATIEPLSLAAEYLAPGGAAIAAPKMRKEISIQVTGPATDPREIKKDAAWQEIARAVYERCLNARSVIAFVEGRAYAEKLAFYVNEQAGAGFAWTHHGSLSKERRLEAEQALREGRLRLLVATSSMELGIDVGEIDLVLQIGCPRTISSTMQRLGRAGHRPDRVSTMYIYPRAPGEALYSGLAAQVAREGGVERSHPPRQCFDVLAQHLVSMAAVSGYSLAEVLEILPRAYPFREVTLADVRDVLCMLAGDYEHDRDIPVRPRVLYDRIHDRVEQDPYSRMLAVSAGGTIPDKGLYTARTQAGVRVGELDEEFVYEARVGDKFLLGSFAWQIAAIQKDTVTVIPSTSQGARPPFWKGEIRGRALRTGFAYGRILRDLEKAQEAGKLNAELVKLGLDSDAAQGAEDYLCRQLSAAGALPDDRTILVEHYRDGTGNHQMMVHSVFGRPVNEPLAILAAEAARRQMDVNINFVADDDGFLLFPYEDRALPEKLLHAISREKAGQLLAAALPATPLYNMVFRYNAARALMMGMHAASRQPLWVQRMRSAQMLDALVRVENHPLVRETKRECLEDYWDLPGVEMILDMIRSGQLRVLEIYPEAPSPMSMILRRQTEASMMYDYAPTPSGIHAAVEDALKQARSAGAVPDQLPGAPERFRLPENPEQLHTLLMIEGDLSPGEVDIPPEWLEELEQAGRACYIEPGLWIAAEHAAEYKAGEQEQKARILRRLLRYRGGQSIQQAAQRYLWPEAQVRAALADLCQDGTAVMHEGIFYHGQLFGQAVRESAALRRREVRTLPASRYAALLAGRVRPAGSPPEQLESALTALKGMAFSPAMWEAHLLPLRVGGYRSEMLDSLLSQGKIFWRMEPGPEISFHLYEEIDWEAGPLRLEEAVAEPEKVLLDALEKRGASFAHSLSPLLGGLPAQDVLMGLAEKGFVRADSFVPVRQWVSRDQIAQSSARQRVNARVMASAGRWELLRPLKELSLEERLEQVFDRSVLLCRETAQGIPWDAAVRLLRLWEYTGRVRRGYFIEGLSGVQYIRDSDYAGVMRAFEEPVQELLWLPATDPMQPWGRCLPHAPGRQFMLLPGTLVALKAGLPVAVLERQGKTLKVFDTACQEEALAAFAREYAARRVFPGLGRLTVKEYPSDAAGAFKAAGFQAEMQDFVLYRGYR